MELETAPEIMRPATSDQNQFAINTDVKNIVAQERNEDV